jgi:2'-5' RNA ligase
MSAGGERPRRLFFALWPDEACRERLAALAAAALSEGAGRPVPPQDWHVTLCFLGSVPQRLIGPLQTAAAALRARPFTLRLDRLRYWAQSRVAVVLGPCPAAAAELARALRELARELGLEPDDKPLRPHITLVRGLVSAPRESRPDVQLSADALVLAESREGVAAPAARYVVRARWPLTPSA